MAEQDLGVLGKSRRPPLLHNLMSMKYPIVSVPIAPLWSVLAIHEGDPTLRIRLMMVYREYRPLKTEHNIASPRPGPRSQYTCMFELLPGRYSTLTSHHPDYLDNPELEVTVGVSRCRVPYVPIHPTSKERTKRRDCPPVNGAPLRSCKRPQHSLTMVLLMPVVACETWSQERPIKFV